MLYSFFQVKKVFGGSVFSPFLLVKIQYPNIALQRQNFNFKLWIFSTVKTFCYSEFMGCAAVRCFFYEMSARNIGISAAGGVHYQNEILYFFGERNIWQ